MLASACRDDPRRPDLGGLDQLCQDPPLPGRGRQVDLVARSEIVVAALEILERGAPLLAARAGVEETGEHTALVENGLELALELGPRLGRPVPRLENRIDRTRLSS